MRVPSHYASREELRKATHNVIRLKQQGPSIVIDFVYDCLRGNNEPIAKCWGEHYVTIDEFIAKGSFDSIARQLKTDLASTNKTNVTMSFLCNSGKHKGLAGCMLARYIISALDININEVIHTCQDSWCNLCTSCQECGPKAFHYREAARKTSIEMFNSS